MSLKQKGGTAEERGAEREVQGWEMKRKIRYHEIRSDVKRSFRYLIDIVF
jgi:hypothetical protein